MHRRIGDGVLASLTGNRRFKRWRRDIVIVPGRIRIETERATAQALCRGFGRETNVIFERGVGQAGVVVGSWLMELLRQDGAR